MFEKTCYWYFCFTPISIPNLSERIFGFSEYLTAVALLAVLFTITDYRYKFRLAITPGKLYLNSYILLATIGILSLLTEVWMAEDWYVPVTQGIDYSIWQLMLGLLFLCTFLTWMYYAFINPPIFNKRNAFRYTNNLYWAIAKSSDDELKVIASELLRSSKALITAVDEYPNKPKVTKRANYKAYAHDTLLLIGDRRLCKHIVASSPITAQAIFVEIADSKKFNIPIGQFARNITREAILQKESFLYGEAEDGFYSGLLGYQKPISKAIYSNYYLIETLAKNGLSPFDSDYLEMRSWDSVQWGAYCRAALIMIEGYLVSPVHPPHEYAIVRLFSELEYAAHDLVTLDGQESLYQNEIYKKFSEVISFVERVVDAINKQPKPPPYLRRVKATTYPKNIYDYVADSIFKFCYQASGIKSSQDIAWHVHYNAVWGNFFEHQTGPAWKIIRNKVRRLLYDEVIRLSKFPNYKSARVLGFCLNILIDLDKPNNSNNFMRESYPLAKALQNWASKNYLRLIKDNPDVAASVLIGSVSFDKKGRRLVKTYSKILGRDATKTYLQLEALKPVRKRKVVVTP